MTARAQRLFSAIGGVSDSLVEEALHPGKTGVQKPRLVRWGALAAAFVLVAGAVWSFPRMGGNAGGNGVSMDSSAAAPGGTVFMSYGGPVLPLTVVDGPEGLPAERTVTWDFAPTLKDQGRGIYRVEITDSTVLLNDGAQALTVTVGYPVTASLRAEEGELPSLSVNGRAAEGELIWGEPAFGEYRLESWGDVSALMADGSLLEEAQKPAPALDQTVTVWELTDSAAPDTDKGAPTLGISFTIDEEKTRVWTWGFNGMEAEEGGRRRYSYFVPRQGERDQRRLLVFLGEVPKGYAMAGYVDGGCDKLLDGVSARMTAFTTTLGELADRLAEEGQGEYRRLEELRVGLRRALAQAVTRTEDWFLMLEDLVSQTLTSTRVVWTTARVTIPAGGKLEVTARYQKEPSFDFACARTENQGLYGFDLGTRLGSSLDFESITARLENAERIRLVRDGFGFTQKGGGWEAVLSPEAEHCEMVVRLTD